ncbi:GD24725 [Drosophila simulans]|uniref:GD24725 n=1 Tax=Drosophila simulans TaxID=7240 RepID=B4NTW0_DROSI|nr:GD24725 [Drosophila simulans]
MGFVCCDLRIQSHPCSQHTSNPYSNSNPFLYCDPNQLESRHSELLCPQFFRLSSGGTNPPALEQHYSSDATGSSIGGWADADDLLNPIT